MQGKHALAALLAFMLLPVAAAQTITPDEDPAVLTPEGITSVGFTASESCLSIATDIITGGTNAAIDYAVTYPAGLTGPDTVTVTYSGADCLGDLSGNVDGTSSLDITALPEAPGMASLQVAVGDGSLPVQVDYIKGHTFTVDTTFPIEVGAEPVTWNATLVVDSNADTMVMTLTDEKAQFGSIGGLFPFKNFIAPPPEGTTETIQFTYTPTATDWEEDKIVFTMWSHFIDDGDMKTPDDTIEWTFVNVNDHGSQDEGKKDSPGLGAVALVGLLGAAAVALRRRS